MSDTDLWSELCELHEYFKKRIAEREADVYAQAKAKHEAYETIRCWEMKCAKLKARLKQAQEWRDYYRAMWMGVSMSEITPPITDAQLNEALEEKVCPECGKDLTGCNFTGCYGQEESS